MSRTLQDTIAWDAAGPVLAYWNETLFPMITEYRNKNAREILKGHPWNGSVDCWMVGRAATEAVPHIIINCPHEKVAKRYEKLIKNDPIIQGSGFRICRRRGNIRYRTSRSGKTPDLSVPAVSGGEISDEGYAMPTNQDAALTAGQPPQERQYPRYPSAPAPYSGGYSVVGPGPGYDLSADPHHMASTYPPAPQPRANMIQPPDPLPGDASRLSPQYPPQQPNPYASPSGSGLMPARRSSTACDYCRRRKIRCPGLDSAPDGRCRNCARLRQPCSFVPDFDEAGSDPFPMQLPSTSAPLGQPAAPHSNPGESSGHINSGEQQMMLYGAHGKPLGPAGPLGQPQYSQYSYPSPEQTMLYGAHGQPLGPAGPLGQPQYSQYSYPSPEQTMLYGAHGQPLGPAGPLGQPQYSQYSYPTPEDYPSYRNPQSATYPLHSRVEDTGKHQGQAASHDPSLGEPSLPLDSIPSDQPQRQVEESREAGTTVEDSVILSEFCGASIGVRRDSVQTPWRTATIGGVVSINGIPMCLTVAHVFLVPYPITSEPGSPSSLTFAESEDTEEASDSDDTAPSVESKTQVQHTRALVYVHTYQRGMLDPFHFRPRQTTLQRSDLVNFGLMYDWALLMGQAVLHAPNRVRYCSREVVISRLARHDPEAEHVLLLSKPQTMGGEHISLPPTPSRVYCSGARSMISLPSSESMVCGFRLSVPQEQIPGISGSWVINENNGDLFGIVVAEDSLDRNLIMVRAKDVFNDIERVRNCSVSLP